MGEQQMVVTAETQAEHEALERAVAQARAIEAERQLSQLRASLWEADGRAGQGYTTQSPTSSDHSAGISGALKRAGHVGLGKLESSLHSRDHHQKRMGTP